MPEPGPAPRRGRSPRRARGLRLLPAAVLLATSTGCIPMDDLMHAIFGRSMRDQVSFDPYENPLMPAEGAVPFAAGNYPAQMGQVNVGQPEGLATPLPPFGLPDMIPPGSEVVRSLVNPVPATGESLARGEVMYERFCAVCHGSDGVGANAPLAPMHPMLPAFNLSGAQTQAYTDGYLYGMIRRGRGLMPEYGHRIAHYDRWHIVNYIRRLQGVVPEGGVPAGAAAGSDAAAGAPGANGTEGAGA